MTFFSGPYSISKGSRSIGLKAEGGGGFALNFGDVGMRCGSLTFSVKHASLQCHRGPKP